MIVTDFRSALKKNSLVFFTFKKITDSVYRTNFLDYLFHGRKKRQTVRNELSLIRNYWKCDPMLYFRYRLYEKNLSSEELLDYIPPYYFYNFYMPSLYDKKLISLTGSKIKMHDFFISRKINTPSIHAVVKNGIVFGKHGEKIEYHGFVNSLLQSRSGTHFMKPDDGRGGKGIKKIERIGSDLFINNELIHPELLESLTRNITSVIQESIKQRSDLDGIYPGSVNTLRVITQNFKGSARIIAVVLRMGRNGSFVDNSSAGGVFASVDAGSGRISDQAWLLHSNKTFEYHPDTGFPFSGFIISGWENIRQQILDFVRKTPEFPDVAWDIAVLENNILAIEINLNYGLDQLQCSLGGMRRKLNVNPSTLFMHTGHKKYYLRP